MALNDRQKNKFRRAIRTIMVVLAAVLLIMGLAVPITNNALAMGLAKDVEALSLPRGTTVVDTTSLAGRLTNPYGSVQYFGAALIKSDCSLEELRAHYMGQSAGAAVYRVQKQTGQEITVLGEYKLSFHESVGKDGYYIVYAIQNGGHTLQWWLDMDIRG